eukprot:jgi/Astpho2/8634/e_gw1.00126.46.1_t
MLTEQLQPTVCQGGHSSLPGLQAGSYRDVESGLEDRPLMPGVSQLDNMLRWGFIKKVYGIISFQLLATVAVSCVIMFNQPAQNFVTGSLPFQICIMLGTLLGLIPIYFYQKKHPHNLILLGLWTVGMSCSVGTICSMYKPMVVLEALVLTAAIVSGLTIYAFWASSKGYDFNFLGPILFSGLMGLFFWGFFQIFFPMGPIGETIFAGLGALIFAGYIVFDTGNLIQRYDMDEYIWAALALYLDIINLFIRILQLLNGRRE